LGLAIFLLFLFLLPLAFIYLFLFASKSALERVGIPSFSASLLLVLSLIGSIVNIPVYSADGLMIALNFGGCILPVAVSAYLIFGMLKKNGYALSGVGASVIVVALVTNHFSIVTKGGVSVPFFIPPLVAAACALITGRGRGYPSSQIAYISGSLGTLLGADLLNLPNLWGWMGPTIASIGGAGVFDGIFLSAIFAVLLIPHR
jgi:uncharacterized membrane protein